MLKQIIISISFLVVWTHTISQIKINEYSASNSGATILDNTGNNSDWIELYNSGSSVINIAGWNLSDDPLKTTKYAFPAGTAVPINGFLRIWCSGKGSPANALGHIHTNFKLTQCNNDWIVLNSLFKA